MASPFQKAISEKRTAVATGFTPSLVTTRRDLQFAELENDLIALKAFNAVDDKKNYKRSALMPKYRPLAEQYLAGCEKIDSRIFSEVTLWLGDVGEMGTFIEWAIKADEQGIPTPERVKRNWQAFCADCVYAWAEEQIRQGQSIEPYFTQVFDLIESVKWRVFERVTASYYKMAGLQGLRDENGNVNAAQVGNVATLETALSLLTKAHEIYPKIGVGDLVKNRIPARIRALKEYKNL